MENVMILEGMVTTEDCDGSAHIAPMGAVVGSDMTHFVLRPYRTSTTHQNLQRRGEGVFHVTDDVELLAHAAVGPVRPPPPMADAVVVRGRILQNACRWYEFRVRDLGGDSQRAAITCHVVHQGRIREFFGLNRAKHAVVEAAILATRVSRLPATEILGQYNRLSVLVDKTGGPQERRAFDYLQAYVQEILAPPDSVP